MKPMEGHENCNHSEVQGVIIRLAEECMMGAVVAITKEIAAGEMDPVTAGHASATLMFATGLETGLRAALMDPIGAQLVLDHLDESAPIQGPDLAEANLIIAEDARHLLEAAARQS